MILDKIKIHDRYSLEIKFDYRLDKQKKATYYKINSYFFLPNSLDINRVTYTKTDFYNDIKTYIRLKTPVYLMRNLIIGDDSPFEKLKLSCLKLAENNSPENCEHFEYFVKLYCSISQSTIRDNVFHITKSKMNHSNMYLINNFISEIEAISVKYRELESIVNIPTIPQNIFKIHEFGNEYLSNIIEIYLYKLLKVLSKKRIKEFSAIKLKVLSLIQSEISYREEKGFNSLPNKERNNETLLYRRSVLKKYIGNKLFLKTNAMKDGNLTEQLIFGIVAGIAMLFATAVAFVSKIKFGDLTFPFFIILIFSYMIKDRIKELSRMYFGMKIRKLFFDHKTKIYNDNKKIIGISKESFDFVKEAKINPEIVKLRDRDHLTEIEDGWVKEKIILFRKQIKIYSEQFNSMYHDYNFEGIIDITRFNIEKFIKKMDDPQKQIYLTEDDDFYKTTGDVVYHINAVIQYTINNDILYKRFRIVLNRNGIKRIEPVI